jgi:magnesium-transporting ATPase (P-type)
MRRHHLPDTLAGTGVDMTTIEEIRPNDEWHSRPADEVAAEMGVDPYQGLDAREVERRLSQYRPNELPKNRRSRCPKKTRPSSSTRCIRRPQRRLLYEEQRTRRRSLLEHP